MNRELTQLLLLGIVGLVLYQVLKKGVTSATEPASDAIAKLWLTLVPNPPPVGVLGNVALPDGSLVPLQSLQNAVRTDANHNVFVKVGSAVYQLQPSDENGNWPAVPVTP